jgi:acetyl-CoA synthetase
MARAGGPAIEMTRQYLAGELSVLLGHLQAATTTEATDEMAGKVSTAIVTEIGPIARPKNVWIVPDMPKTRSGKIMRRVIASISNFADVGDVTTLANPEVVDDIRHHVQSAKVARDDVPRQLTETQFEEIKKFGGE